MYKLTLGHTKRVLSICKSNMQKREEVRKEYREQKCIKKGCHKKAPLSHKMAAGNSLNELENRLGITLSNAFHFYLVS